MNSEGRNNRVDGSADRVAQQLYAGPTKGKTDGQRKGIESNAPAPDSANGFLEGPGVNMAHVAPDFGVPTEGSGWAAKQRAVLREMDRAKRRLR